jgi:predicted DsbA family dithiol-disulfide isomerase
MASGSLLHVTIVSDVICPWCFIGTRRLAMALAETAAWVRPDIEYRAFLLDPTVPPEGVDLRDRLRRKYGVDPEAMFQRIETAARTSGIPREFSRVRRTPDTVPAHTLLRHARGRGTQAALADALFAAYFLEGQDVGNPAVLTDLAVTHGFERAEVETLLRDASGLQTTREEADAAAREGVTGVPYFVFGGRFAFSGAQSPDMFRAAIERAVAALPAQP